MAAGLIALAPNVGDLLLSTPTACHGYNLKIKSFKREDRDQRPPRTQRKTIGSSVPYADATTAHAIFFHWHPGAR
jgi:hypothetical protein